MIPHLPNHRWGTVGILNSIGTHPTTTPIPPKGVGGGWGSVAPTMLHRGGV